MVAHASLLQRFGCRSFVAGSVAAAALGCGREPRSAPGAVEPSRTQGAAGGARDPAVPVAARTFRNPIVPGFHPDPSICRVGHEYYLVTSSFEYFPGIPIFRSRDLVNWQQIGHVLTRASQLPLAQARSSQGIFAPTVRHHAGTFYVVSTNVGAGGSFYVTATDPAGDWSEPIALPEAGFTMDPSLFFDDDGRVYYTRHSGGERGGAGQAVLDLGKQRLASAPAQIWGGTGGVWPEGPHLYKRKGSYYLLLAEGGTSYGHAVTVARSGAPFGPFEAYGGNPILTHRNRRSEPIQATGHADLVEAADGSWWAVFLGIRPWDGAHHNLGRETFLAPVSWSADGWPMINGGAPITLEMSAAGLPPEQPVAPLPARDDFAAARLAFHWNYLRNPNPADSSLLERPGFLRLRGSAVSLNAVGSPAFVGRRQQHARAQVRARLEFEPLVDGQEAGLTLRANEDNHYELLVVRTAGARRVQLRTRVKSVTNVVAERPLAPGALVLGVDATPEAYAFSVAQAGAAAVALGSAPSVPLSTEAAGGFTGVYFGMYAVSPAPGGAPADFDWFEYTPDW